MQKLWEKLFWNICKPEKWLLRYRHRFWKCQARTILLTTKLRFWILKNLQFDETEEKSYRSIHGLERFNKLQSVVNIVRDQRRAWIFFLKEHKLQLGNEKKVKKEIWQHYQHWYQKDHKGRPIIIKSWKTTKTFRTLSLKIGPHTEKRYLSIGII